MFSHSSRGRLTDRNVARFPDGTLFHRVARAVCHAGCLALKELYEAWEMARRARGAPFPRWRVRKVSRGPPPPPTELARCRSYSPSSREIQGLQAPYARLPPAQVR